MTATASSSLDGLWFYLSSLSYTTLCLSAIAGAALIYYFHKNRSPNDWANYGVKCPKLPWNFFLASDFRGIFSQLFIMYGDTVGFYQRGRRVMVTKDLDLLRHILIKDFNNFIDRNDAFMSSSPFAKSLFFAKSADWKRHRQITSPTFTSGKLKYISKFVDKSAIDLTEHLAQCAKNKELVPIKTLTGQFTCEVIAKTAFGLDVNFIGQKDVEFYRYATDMLRINVRTGIWRVFFIFLLSIPHLAKLTIHKLKMQYFDSVNQKADAYFSVILKNTIAQRREQKKTGKEVSRVDFVNLLLQANEQAATGQLKAKEDVFKSADNNKQLGVVQSLTDEEMIGHSMLIIFAGMETTATTLQMCLYELAVHQDIQDKVLQEIKSVVKSETPTSEELASLSYTEQLINETIRLYAPVPNVNRVAKETRTYNNVTIPKGTLVHMPYFYILRDPKNYPDPEKFDPNRFSHEEKEKRDPLAFAAFGHGPRICLGMRLAYLELKQALVHILRKVRVVLNENTEPKKGSAGVAFKSHGLLTPVKPIMLAFELRESVES